jgi:hypothetical protein
MAKGGDSDQSFGRKLQYPNKALFTRSPRCVGPLNQQHLSLIPNEQTEKGDVREMEFVRRPHTIHNEAKHQHAQHPTSGVAGVLPELKAL